VPIAVLPNGFDPQVFRPDGPAARPQGCRHCLFLFVGGPIRRKGLDVLLEAYGDAFAPADEVTLAVYVSGAGGSYQHNALLQELQSFAADPQRPHLQILADPLDDARLASLYRGCDALALPYRGEGFGMPLLEALACGKPVIATDAGPAPEFCPRTTTYWVSAYEVPVPDEAPPLGPLQGAFTWFEPDRRSLAKALREVYEKPADAARRGQAAARAVRKTYAWSAIMSGYQQRVAALLAHSDETSANSEIYSAEISAPSG
jgi:glycosyltransferase involved in cell wall biosynthesis